MALFRMQSASPVLRRLAAQKAPAGARPVGWALVGGGADVTYSDLSVRYVSVAELLTGEVDN